MVVADISKWIVLILMIGLVIFVIKAGLKIINIAIMVLLLSFCWVSFFTETGCARLTIMLYGHPVIAYTTSLEKIDSLSSEREIYFKSSKDVIVNNKVKKYIKIGNNYIVKIPILED